MKCHPCISTEWLIFKCFLFSTNCQPHLGLWLLVVLLLLLLNTATAWELFCLVSSKSGSSPSRVINTVTCWYQMLLSMDVMKKSVKGGRELGGDAGYCVITKNWFLKAVTMGCFFFLLWLAKRTLQILRGCFDVRAGIAGWNNGNMSTLPKFRLWLSPDIKVGAKNSLKVFSPYGSCLPVSWSTTVIDTLSVNLLLYFLKFGWLLCVTGLMQCSWILTYDCEQKLLTVISTDDFMKLLWKTWSIPRVFLIMVRLVCFEWNTKISSKTLFSQAVGILNFC